MDNYSPMEKSDRRVGKLILVFFLLFFFFIILTQLALAAEPTIFFQGNATQYGYAGGTTWDLGYALDENNATADGLIYINYTKNSHALGEGATQFLDSGDLVMLQIHTGEAGNPITGYDGGALWYPEQNMTNSLDVDFIHAFDYANQNLSTWADNGNGSGWHYLGNITITNSADNFQKWKILNGDASNYITNLFIYALAAEEVNLTLVVFNNQTPADLTSTNIMDSYVNISYNFTNTTLLVLDPWLEWAINSTQTHGAIHINGSIYKAFGGLENTTNTSTAGDLHSWILDESEILPATYNYPMEAMEDEAHIELADLTSTSAYLKTSLFPLHNNTQNNLLELYVNNSGGAGGVQVYYCNSSYTTGTITGSPYCALLGTVDDPAEFNHTHTGGNSRHHILNMPINTTTGQFNTIQVTNLSYFVVRGDTGANEVQVYGVSNVTRTNLAQLSLNGGTTWTNVAGTTDLHLHQFDDDDSLAYRACGNFTTTINCSNYRTDTYTFDPLPPVPVTIISPEEDSNQTGYLIINHTTALGSGSLTYNYTLLDNESNFLQIIADQQTGTYYKWPLWLNVLPFDDYRINIETTDSTFNYTSNIQSDLFHITGDALINITANDTLAGTDITSFQGWVYDINTTTNTTFNTSSGYAEVGAIQGNEYIVSITSAGTYSSDSQNITANATGNKTDVHFNLYSFNSVTVNIYNGTTFDYLLKNVTIQVFGNITSFENVTDTGFINIAFLTPQDYEIRFNTSGYNTISKFVTVLNDSTQNISVHMTLNDTTEIQAAQVVDTASQPVEGAVIWLQKQVVASPEQFMTVQEAITDFDGKTSLWVIRDTSVYYRFAVIYDGEARPIQPSGNLFTEKTSFIPGVEETIQIVIDIEETEQVDLTEHLSIVTDMYLDIPFNNNSVNYSWIDGSNAISGAKLVIEATYLNNASYGWETVYTETSTDVSGMMNYTFTEINGTRWRATGYILFSDHEEIFEQIQKDYTGDILPEKNLGLLYAFLVLLVVALVTVKWGPLASSVLTVVTLFPLTWFGLVAIPASLITTMIAVALILFIKAVHPNEQ